eukprot:gene1257-4466_t
MASDWFGGHTTSNVYDKQLGRTVSRTRDRWWNAYMLFYERVNVGDLDQLLQEPASFPTGDSQNSAESVLGIDRTPSIASRLSVMYDNIVWAHEHELFNKEYFRFIRELLEALVKSRLSEDPATSSQKPIDFEPAESMDLGLSFLLDYALMTDDAIRDDITKWPVVIDSLCELYAVCRELTRERLLNDKIFSKLLILSPNQNTRQVFAELVFLCISSSLLNDGQDIGIHFLVEVVSKLKEFYKTGGIQHVSNLDASFDLLLRVCELGTNYCQLFVDAEFFTMLLLFLRRIDSLSQQIPPATFSMPLSELYTEQVPEDVMPPTLVLFNEQVGGTNDQLPLFAEACDFLQDQGLLKYLVEVHHDNNYLRKLIKDSSFCNRGFSLLAISVINMEVDIHHHYEMHPFLGLLDDVFSIEDGLRVFRFHHACKSTQFVHLFRIMSFCKQQFYKKSYFVAKLLARLLNRYPEVHDYLLSENMFESWSWVIRWLEKQLQKAPMRPFHNSNQDSKDYMLERTQSALNLHLQLSEAILEPSSADEDEDEDIEDDENKRGQVRKSCHSIEVYVLRKELVQSKGTSIKEAIRQWEEKEGKSVSEASVVKLLGKIPPIEKMDAALSSLAHVEQLSLSTNCIEKIANLNGFNNLRILSLGRNNIKSLAGLEPVSKTLEELWISYNNIEKLKGIEVLTNLKVADWKQFELLAKLPNLESLVMVGNPLQEKHADSGDWVEQVSQRLPQLKKLDGVPVVRDT